MTRRTVGVSFCGIAAFLYAARYVCAAIFGGSLASKSAPLFTSMYKYVGSGLTIAAVIALLAGVGYLVWAEAKVSQSTMTIDVSIQKANRSILTLSLRAAWSLPTSVGHFGSPGTRTRPLRTAIIGTF